MVGDNYNNSGNNFGHMGPVNLGKQPFTLTVDLISQVVAACPKDLPVRVIAVGTQGAFPMRDSIGAALRAAGYSVEMDSAMMYMPPPERPLTVVPETGRTLVLVTPNV